jgi:hypothetical protein
LCLIGLVLQVLQVIAGAGLQAQLVANVSLRYSILCHCPAGKALDVTRLLTAAAAPLPTPSTPLLFHNIRNVTLLVRHSRCHSCLQLADMRHITL